LASITPPLTVAATTGGEKLAPESRDEAT